MNKVTIPTIQELRQQGWKARVTIFRKTSPHSDYYSMKDLRESPHGIQSLESKGGRIQVDLRSPEGVESTGESLCNDNDNFVISVGRTLATARALGITGSAEPRFKKGDFIYYLHGSAIRKDEVLDVRSYKRFDEKDLVFTNEHYYSVANSGGWMLALGEDIVGANKEEVVEKLLASVNE